MNELLQHKYDVLASLYHSPCTLEELSKRDFCLRLPMWYIHDIIRRLEQDGYLKEGKNGVWETYRRKSKKKLNELDYEVD